MSRTRKTIWIVGGLLFIGLAATALRPVPIVPEDECLAVTGRVASIQEGGTHDVVFSLEDVEERFYVNRGLERGLELETLRRDLVGSVVTLKYPSYWTPLDPMNRTRHVSKVDHGDETVFDETR